MNKYHVLAANDVGQRLQKCHMFVRNVGGEEGRQGAPARAPQIHLDPVGGQGLDPAMAQPVVGRVGGVEEVEEHLLVVAEQVQHLETGWTTTDEVIHHLGRLRATVEIIAEEDQDFAARQAPGIGLDHVGQRVQQAGFAMHIPHRIDRIGAG